MGDHAQYMVCYVCVCETDIPTDRQTDSRTDRRMFMTGQMKHDTHAAQATHTERTSIVFEPARGRQGGWRRRALVSSSSCLYLVWRVTFSTR